LSSLIRNQTIAPKIAFSGEITLAGRVLPVGGIKEKVIAAKRAGITHIFLPKNNEKDLGEIPKHVRAGLSFQFVSSVEQALQLVFSKNARNLKRRKRRK